MNKVHQNLPQMNIDELAKIFATISRYASTEEEGGQESIQFAKLKSEVAKNLEGKSYQLTLDDMLQWSIPLAAEEIKNEKIWRKFKDIVLEQQSKLNFRDHCNLAWSFTKAGFDDSALWKIFEESFTQELQSYQKEK